MLDIGQTAASANMESVAQEVQQVQVLVAPQVDTTVKSE